MIRFFQRHLRNLLRDRISSLRSSLYSSAGALLQSNFGRSLQLCSGLFHVRLAMLPLLLAALLFARPAFALDHGQIAYADLPKEAQLTLRLIRAGGPFPYAKDGSIFGNYEKRLPQQVRGFYREYTVPTPGIKHRGARRIVTGGGAEPVIFYFTSDHYRHFQRIVE